LRIREYEDMLGFDFLLLYTRRSYIDLFARDALEKSRI
jgi:hypothetical protein